MITIICAVVAVGCAIALSWCLVELKILRRELADMTEDRDIQVFKAQTALRISARRAEELSNATERVGSITREFDSALRRMSAAETDADRLYPIAKEHLETIDLIETKLPPDAERMDVSKEREAIRLHEEAVKSRTK